MSQFVLNESISNGYDYSYLLLVSIISIFFGISVIIAKNPIISILFLIGLFVSVSIYLMLLGLFFIGLSYLLVYVGAISILFIFILMLISVRTSELLTEGKNGIPLAVLVIFAFNYSVNSISTQSIDMLNTIYYYYYKFTSGFSMYNISSYKNFQGIKVANVTSRSWDSSLIDNNHITSIGNVMYSNLSILLLITSLILLVAMVGTIVITIKKNK